MEYPGLPLTVVPQALPRNVAANRKSGGYLVDRMPRRLVI